MYFQILPDTLPDVETCVGLSEGDTIYQDGQGRVGDLFMLDMLVTLCVQLFYYV